MVVLSFVCVGCAGSHGVTERPAITTTTALQPVPRICHASDGRTGARQVASRSGSIWVWIESAAGQRLRVGSLVKVVWRITGADDPRTMVSDPHGRDVTLSFGPELHGGSTFVHPGEEYGTGFVPKLPGCWQFGMVRGTVGGWVSLAVEP